MSDMETKYLQFCRFYKGEKECPFDDFRDHIWEAEMLWVKAHENNRLSLECSLERYTMDGLIAFEMHDGVPISLKAVLYEKYCDWFESASGFKDWYISKYKNGSF